MAYFSNPSDVQFTTRTCVIVESAHSIPSLRDAFSEIGMPSARFIATHGRLMDVDEARPFSSAEIRDGRRTLNPSVSSKIAGLDDTLIFIATDDDIEGELIAYDAYRLIDQTRNEVSRVSFSEVTPSGVIEGLKKSRSINYSCVEKALARRAVDKVIQGADKKSGRILSMLLHKINSDPHGRDDAVVTSELVLSKPNTFSVLAYHLSQGDNAEAVMLSMQKLYSRGKISYPRTLAGVSPERNRLASSEPHGPIVTLNSIDQDEHYFDAQDIEVWRTIHERPALAHYQPADQAVNKQLRLLLRLYELPYSRASTASFMVSKASRFVRDSDAHLSRFGLNALYGTIRKIPNLLNHEAHKALHEALYQGEDLTHQERINKATTVIFPDQGNSTHSPSQGFHYPNREEATPSPSQQHPFKT